MDDNDKDPPVTEKKCSFCGQFSWDSQFKWYGTPCPSDGKECNSIGGTWIDGVPQ